MEKSIIVKHKKKRILQIIDYIYPLTKLSKNKYEIKDHINLSGINPLTGPKFIPLNNIYISKKGIIVCGLKKGVVPNIHEKKVLQRLNVSAYCYNLVSTVIYASYLGFKVKAIGILNVKHKTHTSSTCNS
ncbi:MAG: hypothetical protein HYY52_01335 [Candidatus Melainabacteria bacterium]|nr:hypothetical protein [Candidatus Melainabacteria bacterium]